MFLSHFYKHKYIIVGLVILITFLTVLALREDSNLFYAEREMARNYNPTMRQKLFEEIVEKEKYDLLPILGAEINETLKCMSDRVLYYQQDMTSKWGEKFDYLNDAHPLCAFTDHVLIVKPTFYRFGTYLIDLSLYEKLTPSELDLIKQIADVWKEYDSMIENRKLDRYYLKTKGHAVRQVQGNDHPSEVTYSINGDHVDADAIALHYYELIQSLNALPCTFSNFIAPTIDIKELKIKTSDIDEVITDQREIESFINTLRTYAFKKEDISTNLKSDKITLVFSVTSEVSLDTIDRISLDIYEDYMTVLGVWHGDYYRNNNMSDRDYLDFTIDGTYKCDIQLFEDLKTLIIQNILK